MVLSAATNCPIVIIIPVKSRSPIAIGHTLDIARLLLYCLLPKSFYLLYPGIGYIVIL